MSEFSKVMMDKCMNFSIRIVNLCHFLNEDNYAEAQNAISRKDFIAKVYISLKECNESLYWIELLHRTRIITHEQYESIYTDCEELKKILVSITKTFRENDIATS